MIKEISCVVDGATWKIVQLLETIEEILQKSNTGKLFASCYNSSGYLCERVTVMYAYPYL